MSAEETKDKLILRSNKYTLRINIILILYINFIENKFIYSLSYLQLQFDWEVEVKFILKVFHNLIFSLI